MPTLREKLAALAHYQWSGWMKHMFEIGEERGGKLVLPSWATSRWRRQMRTRYADLSESEKESDRKEADKFIKALDEHCRGGKVKE